MFIVILQCRHARPLNGEEDPGIYVGLYLRETGYKFLISGGKTYSPPRHVECLRKGMEFDRYVFRAVDLEYAKAFKSVERYLGIRSVVTDYYVVLFGKLHYFCKESLVADSRCRIIWIVDEDHLYSVHLRVIDSLQIGKEPVLAAKRHEKNFATGKPRA